MLRMIAPVVAGAGVREDRQPIAIERDPLSEVAELLRPDRQLAASARMRADGIPVEVTDGNVEALLGGAGQGLGAIELVGVEIDMRVEVTDRAFGHAAF